MYVGVDRTPELEARLKAVLVHSEDTCCFFSRKPFTQVLLRRCFYCEHYVQDSDNENKGTCKYKQVT